MSSETLELVVDNARGGISVRSTSSKRGGNMYWLLNIDNEGRLHTHDGVSQGGTNFEVNRETSRLRIR